MKNLIMMFALTVSVNSFADVIKEYDQAQEVVCHNEIKAQNCVNKDGTENLSCVDGRMDKLSTACQAIHLDKKKK